MKNYLQDNYPANMSYHRLGVAVDDAWEKVGRLKFEELINNMKEHCQAVIDANIFLTRRIHTFWISESAPYYYFYFT
jgi:hypothetical protein